MSTLSYCSLFNGIVCVMAAQDAQEYFSYLLESIDRALHARTKLTDVGRLKSLFGFSMETRIECLTSHRVSYHRFLRFNKLSCLRVYAHFGFIDAR